MRKEAKKSGKNGIGERMILDRGRFDKEKQREAGRGGMLERLRATVADGPEAAFSVGGEEVFLFRAALGADPAVGQVGKGCALGDIVFVIAFFRVVHVSAGAFHFLHVGLLVLFIGMAAGPALGLLSARYSFLFWATRKIFLY
jgi:hypothetical protein